MHGNMPDDTQLVSLAIAGNRESFGTIVAKYQSLVCSIALGATGDVVESEDVAQETFLVAWRGLRELRDPHG